MAISSQGHRRRRRRRSHSGTAARQVRVTQGRQFRPRSAEVLACFGVVVAAATLIILVWINASRSIMIEHNDLRARVEATVAGQALVLADMVRRELIGVEQSLKVLKSAVQADPDKFDMRTWREQMPALTDVTDNIFIADEQFVVRHDSNPANVGMALGAMTLGTPGRALDREDNLLIGLSAEKVQSRQHAALLMMRLDRPGGWMVGASYRTSALARVFAEAGLGIQGMTALVDMRAGQIQAVAGQVAAHPVFEIGKSAMFAAMNERPDGTWIGPSAPDGVTRIHGFHRIPARMQSIVVAVSEAQALLPAQHLAEGIRSVAIVATIVVVAGMSTALYAIWIFRARRRLRQAIEREQVLVANIQAELSDVRARLESRTGQFRALQAGIGEGAVILDAELRLAEWNERFPPLFGIAPELLQPGLPIDELIRTQAREGAFGILGDIEAEVAQRVAQLRAAANQSGPLLYRGPSGRMLVVLSNRHADGSLLLVVREPTEAELQPQPVALGAPTSGPVATL